MTAKAGTVRRFARTREQANLSIGLIGVLICFCLAASLAGCASTQVTTAGTVASEPEAEISQAKPEPLAKPERKETKTAKRIKRGGGYQKIGQPYRIAGRLYVPQRDPNYDESGIASWYGKQFHGRLTANGERFDMNSLSAAHPTMPLPAYARVTNMANGRSIVVRVNDRGPFAHNRVIDLSKKTAAVLDFKNKGTAKVRVQFVGDAPLDGQDEKFLVASYKGPGPGPQPNPQLAKANSEPIVTAYSAPPAARPATAFPEALAKGKIDRAVVESGTPFDPSKASGKILRSKSEAAAAEGNAVANNSYAANERVSVAFAAIDELVR